MTVEIFDTPMARVEIDRARGLVKLIRTPLPIDAAGFSRVVDDFQLYVPMRERARWVMLQDMRVAPPILDAALEKAIAQDAPRLFGRFAARALLMMTAVGRLQANRFIAGQGPEVRAFTDESEAMRFLEDHLKRIAELPKRG
jgi:hypothetical protein